MRKDGSHIWVSLETTLARDVDGGVTYRVVVSNITERRQTEARLRESEDFLNETQMVAGLGSYDMDIASGNCKTSAIFHSIFGIDDEFDHSKTQTRADAVGIRLQDGEDFPYFAQEGFPKDFLLTENTLLERTPDGVVCRNKDGAACQGCTCGLVISGYTDPANPLFTTEGSCWTNDSFQLLDIPSCEDPRFHPRNQCVHQGYASVALVPIRSGDRIVGLMCWSGPMNCRWR